MVAIPLTSGAYEAAATIANAQKSINLFAEVNPKETEPAQPVTQYARPGLRTVAGAGPPGSNTPQNIVAKGPATPAAGRCLYRSSRGAADPNGDLFAVVDHDVYYIDPDENFNLLGMLQPAPLGQSRTQALTPVYMQDNGTDILIVDGTNNGYTVNIKSRAFAQFTDPNFMGSVRLDFLDTFILMNVPGTNQWYVTPPLALSPIDPLAIGIKTAWSDNISVVIAVQREAYVLGPEKGEVWYNAGAIPFSFQLLPGTIIEWGIQAPYSACKLDAYAYWLAAAPEGGYMAVKAGAQNVAQRVSNHGVEYEWKKYERVDDCIGSTYQMQGHHFIRFSFPTADKCWVFDAITEQWFEDLSIDQNGDFHRSRNTFCAFCYQKNYGLDFSNGSLYEISQEVYTDGGVAIPWIRSFPHIVNEMRFVQHNLFMADVQGGVMPDTTEADKPVPQPLPPGLLPANSIPNLTTGIRPSDNEMPQTPVVNFRMSKDGGATFGKMRSKRNMSSGHYRSPVRWRNLGIARDAVFEVSSTAQMCPALQGAWIEPVPAQA